VIFALKNYFPKNFVDKRENVLKGEGMLIVNTGIQRKNPRTIPGQVVRKQIEPPEDVVDYVEVVEEEDYDL